MDLVSFETPEEYRHFALMMHRGEDDGHGHRDDNEGSDGDDDNYGDDNGEDEMSRVAAVAAVNMFSLRQHQLYLHLREEVQLPGQGLRRRRPAARQHQRLVLG